MMAQAIAIALVRWRLVPLWAPRGRLQSQIQYRLLLDARYQGSSSENFVPNSGFRKFHHGTSIVATYCQCSSKKVDAYRDKLNRRRTKLTIFATVDVWSTTDASLSHIVSAFVYSTTGGTQRAARVRLRQLILVSCYCFIRVCSRTDRSFFEMHLKYSYWHGTADTQLIIIITRKVD